MPRNAAKRVQKPVRIFLSHSSTDKRFAKRLSNVFDNHKLRYWYSRRHIAGAEQWHDEIGKALATCNWFVLALTPASAKSKWVKHELLFALEQKAYKNHIVVVNVRPANFKKLSWTLSQFQWVDFTRDFDRGCKALLQVWRKKYRAA